MPFSEDSLYQEFGYTCAQEYRGDCDYRSACESLDKLIEYFGSDFAYALDKGAHIVEYTVHKAHVRFGLFPEESIEVAFDVTKATNRKVILLGKNGGYDEQPTENNDNRGSLYDLATALQAGQATTQVQSVC